MATGPGEEVGVEDEGETATDVFSTYRCTSEARRGLPHPGSIAEAASLRWAGAHGGEGVSHRGWGGLQGLQHPGSIAEAASLRWAGVHGREGVCTGSCVCMGQEGAWGGIAWATAPRIHRQGSQLEEGMGAWGRVCVHGERVHGEESTEAGATAPRIHRQGSLRWAGAHGGQGVSHRGEGAWEESMEACSAFSLPFTNYPPDGLCLLPCTNNPL